MELDPGNLVWCTIQLERSLPISVKCRICSVFYAQNELLHLVDPQFSSNAITIFVAFVNFYPSLAIQLFD
jgi:hypothetical protein